MGLGVSLSSLFSPFLVLLLSRAISDVPFSTPRVLLILMAPDMRFLLSFFSFFPLRPPKSKSKSKIRVEEEEEDSCITFWMSVVSYVNTTRIADSRRLNLVRSKVVMASANSTFQGMNSTLPTWYRFNLTQLVPIE